MALLNINANFSMLVSVLERIAVALERTAGPPAELPGDRIIKKRGPESIITYGDGDREWAKQNFRSLIHEQGHAPEREEALLNVSMKRYDYEKKHQDDPGKE
jgi:hypothetical protein